MRNVHTSGVGWVGRTEISQWLILLSKTIATWKTILSIFCYLLSNQWKDFYFLGLVEPCLLFHLSIIEQVEGPLFPQLVQIFSCLLVWSNESWDWMWCAMKRTWNYEALSNETHLCSITYASMRVAWRHPSWRHKHRPLNKWWRGHSLH